MTAFIYDAAGFVTGTYDGPGQPASSTTVQPPANAAHPLRFVNGAWLLKEDQPPTWDTAPAEYFQIDVGPFFDRFGGKAIVITSSEDSVVRGMLALVTPRKFIDLKREDLPVLVGILVTKGIITEAEMAAVLDPHTTDYERHLKGLPQPAE